MKQIPLLHEPLDEQLDVAPGPAATTSVTGRYAIRILAPAVLAPDATNGVIKFSVMTGDSVGWDAVSFSGHLVQTMAGNTVALPSAASTANLHLMPH